MSAPLTARLCDHGGQAATDARLDREPVPRSTLATRGKMLEDKLGTMAQDIRYIKDAFLQKAVGVEKK
jgi:hypothetical protein